MNSMNVFPQFLESLEDFDNTNNHDDNPSLPSCNFILKRKSWPCQYTQIYINWRGNQKVFLIHFDLFKLSARYLQAATWNNKVDTKKWFNSNLSTDCMILTSGGALYPVSPLSSQLPERASASASLSPVFFFKWFSPNS